LLAHGRWFSPGTPASSTTKTGRHDILIAEILLKVALRHKKINQSINQSIILPDPAKWAGLYLFIAKRMDVAAVEIKGF
jgi:hypothetical protein